ncbi:hypothetical protein CYMTET_52582 [Cymbomonas tetramitiformis]|uniref:DUF659 domain-containing protein n=1 Tax=Cymbomonas tetramitiformis TaxID=36881 RepID=A0AAE0EQX8_9CHLO|nr:hypothetical protein CYMTET_52582 [Cymbomonas tetramitiformis]
MMVFITSERIVVLLRGCKYEYSATASRVASHILGDDKNVRACKYASEEEKISASENSKGRGKKKRNSLSAISSEASRSCEEGEGEEEEVPTRNEDETRQHLNALWTKAFAKNGLAPNVIDDPDFREAIVETHKAKHKYEPLTRRTMTYHELPKLKDMVRSQLDDLFTGDKAETLVSDGWDTSAKDSLINFLLASLAGEEFLDDENVTGEHKTARFLADLILKYVKLVKIRRGCEPDSVCTDNPTVMREARALVEEELPSLFTHSCTIHGVHKWIEDICALPTVAKLLKDHEFIVKKLRNKQFLHAELFRAQSSEELKPLFTTHIDEEDTEKEYDRFEPLTLVRKGATRMGSAYDMLQRNVKLQPALEKVVGHQDYNKRCGIAQRRVGLSAEQVAAEIANAREAYQTETGEAAEELRLSSAERQKQYVLLKELIRGEGLWELTTQVVDLLSPLISFLKDLDSHQAMMGEVYRRCERLTKDWEEGDVGIEGHFAKYKAEDFVSLIPLEEREKLQEIGITRWNYLHSPLHSFAYCINPRLHFVDHFADPEVRRDFAACALKFCQGDEDLAAEMEVEYTEYAEKEGAWSNRVIWMQAKLQGEKHRGHLFWKMHGDKAPTLRDASVKALTMITTAGGAERNWSAHDIIFTKRRSRMNPTTLANWIFVFTNLRLLEGIDARKGKKRKKHAVSYESEEYPKWEEQDSEDED